MPTIADRIRSAREKRGLTTYEAAELAGVSQSSWSDWENSVSVPRGANRLKAAQALEVSAEWLRTGEVVTVHRGSHVVSLSSPGAYEIENAIAFSPEDQRLLDSAIVASEGYLELLHQPADLSLRIQLAGLVVRKLRELGKSAANELTLTELHETLSPAVFP